MPKLFFWEKGFFIVSWVLHGLYMGSDKVRSGVYLVFFSAEGGFYKGSIEALEQLLIERAWPTIL